jgi:hypothetical protein
MERATEEVRETLREERARRSRQDAIHKKRAEVAEEQVNMK